MVSEAILEWFQSKGIRPETVERFDIRVEADGAISFPYGSVGRKLRYGVPTGERSFRWPKGTDPVLFNREEGSRENVFLCEGETDTLRLHQEILDYDIADVGVVGLPGIETWNKGMADDLTQAGRVYVVLDNDLDYRVSGRVDEAYRNIRRELGSKAQRVVLPRGVNDLCEFFEDYNFDSLRLLLDRTQRPGESRFTTLDLTTEPPPVRWVVEGVICRGDIHLFIGEPGVGKSWLTMGLALAVASGWETYLGHKLREHGRVLYLDEENPEDLVFDRFRKLGLKDEGAKNIRFINNQGVRLDRDPTVLIDEALDFNPALIIMDSLTRFHSEDENSAGAMSGLFNDAVKPLARQTGAALVLIHHANKGDALSGYKRSRGSGDITASVDTGYDVREIDAGVMSISNFKSRRAAQGETLYVSMLDKADGRVQMVPIKGYNGGLF